MPYGAALSHARSASVERTNARALGRAGARLGEGKKGISAIAETPWRDAGCTTDGGTLPSLA